MSPDYLDYLKGFAFCAIRPAVALYLIPFGQSGSLGILSGPEHQILGSRVSWSNSNK
ncbi:hypothetical protein [Paraburkholderia sp. RL17-337-BIB-A]|uniref:hypothetical protein n=1 Tax=Paraburkholderia sp. RL17-337-BIB-A TaxID=3031636 RepID=UPI0038BC3EC4